MHNRSNQVVVPRGNDTLPDPTVARLSLLRQESQDQFEKLPGVLGEVHHALQDIGNNFDQLMALVDDVNTARTKSNALRNACLNLSDHLNATHTAIASKDLAQTLSEGLSAVETLQRECRQLTAIAWMTRVTGRSIKIDAIEDYIVSLRSMIQRLSVTTQSVEGSLGRIGAAIKRAAIQLGQASECARNAMKGRSLTAQSASSVSRTDVVAKSVAVNLKQTAEVNTRMLMTGIQFSDAFCQRLSHIEIIMHEAGIDHNARVLARAQIIALVDDTSQMLNTTRKALEQLGAVGKSAAQSLIGNTGEHTAQLLNNWRSELDDGHEIERAVSPALIDAMDAMKQIDMAIIDAGENLETLTATALDVSLATVNAVLLARRSGSAKAAMGVLSTAVRERADACNILSSRCRTSFTCINTSAQNAGFNELLEEINQLKNHISQAGADLEMASGMFIRLNAMQKTAEQSAWGLQKAVREGVSALSALPGRIDALRSFATELSGDGKALSDCASLARFEKIYTMDREREIHAKVTRRPFLVGESASRDGHQSLGDIVF